MKSISSLVEIHGHTRTISRITRKAAESRAAADGRIYMHDADVYLMNIEHAVPVDVCRPFREVVADYEAERGCKVWFWSVLE